MCFFCQKMTYPDSAHALVSAEPAVRANAGGVVSDYTALVSGQSWWGGTATGKSMIVSYSFETSSDRADYAATDLTSALLDSFRPYTAAEKALALQALNIWAAETGLIFVEADSGRGDIRFGAYDFSHQPGSESSVGFAYYPSGQIDRSNSYVSEVAGDVFMDRNFLDTGNDIERVGVFLHEIGHAIGLKHSFEGETTLETSLDNKSITVMSYTGWYTQMALGRLDIDAGRFLYGTNADESSVRASWSWNPATDTLFQVGTTGNDTIRGVGGYNDIEGGFGDDLMVGANLNDTLKGGSGSDTQFGMAGDDTFIATAADMANDSFIGGEGVDTLHLVGGTGRFGRLDSAAFERITSSTSLTTLLGTDANNYFDVNSLTLIGESVFDGLGGNDTVYGSSRNETFRAGLGSDYIDAGLGFDTIDLSALAGAAVVRQYAGGSDLYLTVGSDQTSFIGVERIVGSTTGDNIEGTIGDNALAGMGGNDTLLGDAGNDTIAGGSGADSMDGGTGGIDVLSYETTSTNMSVTLGPVWMISGASERTGDVFTGFEEIRTGTGNDVLNGSTLGDRMQGWRGSDTMLGGLGNDTLNGGEGKDLFTGGGGQDAFVFTAIADTGAAFLRRDVINTFAHGDKIDLRSIDAQGNVSGDQAFRFIADQAFSGASGELRFTMTNISATGVKAYLVEADTDGNRAADLSLQIYTAPTADRTGLAQSWFLAAWDFLL